MVANYTLIKYSIEEQYLPLVVNSLVLILISLVEDTRKFICVPYLYVVTKQKTKV